MEKVKFEFKNEVVENKTIITLSGVVREPYPWDEEDEAINEKLIRNTLDGVNGDVLIRLNSPGGDVFEGISICNYLKSIDNKVTIEITGVAASAASIIAMGADKVIMDKGTSMMIHEASTIAWGNKTEIQKTLNALTTIDKSLIAIYQDKTGLDTDTLNGFLTNETWFTAEEAVENGFADEVGNVKVEESIEEEEVDNSVSSKNDETDKYEDVIKELSAKVDALMNKEEQVVTKEKPKTNLLNQFLGGI